MKRLAVIAATVAALSVTGVATGAAGNIIHSSDIARHAVRNSDLATNAVNSRVLRDKSVDFNSLNDALRRQLNLPVGSPQPGAKGDPGQNGQNGAPGAKGDKGDKGDPGEYAGEHWGVIARNTIGSAVGELRSGPFVSGHFTSAGASQPSAPPFGIGSLGLETKDGTEKIAFGNEVDFFNDNVDDLSDVGFRVFTTGENVGAGEPMPNITFEIDPNLNGAGDNYSSLVWIPADPASGDVNRWSGYLDATSSGEWYLTGGEGTITGCNQTTFCDFDEIQNALDDSDGNPAKILTVAVAKGRDTAFVGAVDGLRINDEVFDFEPFGVVTTTP